MAMTNAERHRKFRQRQKAKSAVQHQGPDTAGLIQALARHHPAWDLPGPQDAVSTTTRPPRPGEMDGKDYHFVDTETFTRLVEDNAFLEHARVFGNFYGTPAARVEAALAQARMYCLTSTGKAPSNWRKKCPRTWCGWCAACWAAERLSGLKYWS